MTKAILAALLLLCNGCALTVEQIDVPYQPAAAAMAVQGASGVRVDVAATDSRTTYRDRVSSKKNGYGMEMAAITTTADVPGRVADAFRRELSARGFVMAQGGGTVQVELVRFYNDFKNGFFSGEAAANVAFNVKVVAANGAPSFSKYYEGVGTEPNIQLANGDNARLALIKAFTAALNSAVSDRDFINAVLATGGRVPVAMAVPTP